MISIIVKMAANKLEADEGEKIKRQQECENRLQEEPEMELPKLPEEVLVMIMKRVINNPKANKKTARDLGNMELVCRDWQRAALSVYKDLCLKRRKERSHTAPIFTWQNFDTEIRPFPDKCKIFFKKLVNTCCAFLDRERILDAKVDKLDVLRGLEQLMAERQRQYDAMNSRLPAHQRGIYDMYYRRSHYAEDEDGGLFGSPDKSNNFEFPGRVWHLHRYRDAVKSMEVNLKYVLLLEAIGLGLKSHHRWPQIDFRSHSSECINTMRLSLRIIQSVRAYCQTFVFYECPTGGMALEYQCNGINSDKCIVV